MASGPGLSPLGKAGPLRCWNPFATFTKCSPGPWLPPAASLSPGGPARFETSAQFDLWPAANGPQSIRCSVPSTLVQSASAGAPEHRDGESLAVQSETSSPCRYRPTLGARAAPDSSAVVKVLRGRIVAHKTCRQTRGGIIDHRDQIQLLPASFQPVMFARIPLHQLPIARTPGSP